MARDPHEGVDFAPAWLSFSNNNKKKTEKSVHGTLHTPTPLLKTPQKSSQEPSFRSAVGGARVTGSPSRSLSGSGRWSQSSSNSRPGGSHRSADFTLLEDTFTISPSKEQTVWGRSGSNKVEMGSHSAQGKLTPLRRMEVDFPSLCESESAEGNKTKPSVSLVSSGNPLNMWEKPLVLKSSEAEGRKMESSPLSMKSQITSSIYKNLVPKPAPHKKQPYRRTMSVPLTVPAKGGNSIVELITRGSKREHSAIGRQVQAPLAKATHENYTNHANHHAKQGKVGQRESVGQAMPVDIGVIDYKKHRKGKSHFLKTLRQSEDVGDSPDGVKVTRSGHFQDECGNSPDESGDSPDSADPFEEEMEIPGETIRGFSHRFYENDADVPAPLAEESLGPLSSSLEAEHRFLREMGWQCNDELTIEEQPLTEDEIQDFFQQNKNNGQLSIPTSGHREREFRNALSCWKFSGRRRIADDPPADSFGNAQQIASLDNTIRPEKDSLTSDEDF